MAMDSGINHGRVEPTLPDWTRRLAQGDEEAWRWFHQRYYLPLLRYASQRTGNPSNASEIVQQGYLRIARHIRPFAAEEDFWNWLCCVVHCAAVDHGRNASRRMVLLEKLAHWRAAQSPEDAQWSADAQPVPALVEEALGKLPSDEAALLRRKYCDGWSTQELAADLGTTPKAIENRLARLRDRLREIILHLQ
jgi:RNA polymerase sigma-70 factor (ECF subfamily)